MNYLWKKENTPLFNNEIKNQDVPSVKPFIVDGAKACVIICPGGGYAMKCSDYEGDDVAQWFNTIGVSAFVLDYRVRPYKHPVPVIDGKRAVRYARYYAEQYGYDKDKIGILGFSAGGHLAGSVGTYKGDFGYEPVDEIDNESSRPNFMILCYPVISFLNHPHIGSYHNLAEQPSLKAARELSVEYNVDNTTPPTFIFHTSKDQGVPVENSLSMAMALSKHGVPFEIHTHKDGPHGVGLGGEYPYTALWTKECENWLKSMGYIG